MLKIWVLSYLLVVSCLYPFTIPGPALMTSHAQTRSTITQSRIYLSYSHFRLLLFRTTYLPPFSNGHDLPSLLHPAKGHPCRSYRHQIALSNLPVPDPRPFKRFPLQLQRSVRPPCPLFPRASFKPFPGPSPPDYGLQTQTDADYDRPNSEY